MSQHQFTTFITIFNFAIPLTKPGFWTFFVRLEGTAETRRGGHCENPAERHATAFHQIPDVWTWGVSQPAASFCTQAVPLPICWNEGKVWRRCSPSRAVHHLFVVFLTLFLYWEEANCFKLFVICLVTAILKYVIYCYIYISYANFD